MAEELLGYLDRCGDVISLVGVLAIVGGFLLAATRYTAGCRRLGPEISFKNFKVGMGRALMLGLEILVVADVIETITVRPTFTSLGILGVLVVVRTVVSWTLSLEVEGRWPWQAAGAEA